MARTLVGWTDAHYALDPNTNLALPNAAIDVQVLETGEALTDLQTPPGYIGQPFPPNQARTDESGFYGFTVPEGTGPVRVRVAATATEAPGQWLTPAGQVLDNGPVRGELAKKLDVETASNTYVTKGAFFANVADYGALGDGVTDCLAAFQAAFADVVAAGGGTIYVPRGTFVLSDEWDIFRAASPRCDVVIQGQSQWNTKVLANFYGADKSLVKSTGAATTRSSPTSFRDIQFGAVSTSGGVNPCLVDIFGWGESRMESVRFGSTNNTHLRASSLQNVRCRDVVSFYGGKHFNYRATNGKTFTLAADGTLTASGFAFASKDVGRTIYLGGTPASKHTITAYTSSTKVTVDTATEAAPAKAGVPGQFEASRGTTTAGSDIFDTLNVTLKTQDVGRVIYIRDAADGPYGPGLLRAKVAEIQTNPASGYGRVRLDRPATRTTPEAAEFAVPVIDLWTPDEEGVTGATSNDVKIETLHIENHCGVGLVVDGAIFCHITNAKIHGEHDPVDTSASTAMMWLDDHAGIFSGEFDGVAVGDARAALSNSNDLTTFDWLAARHVVNGKAFSVGQHDDPNGYYEIRTFKCYGGDGSGSPYALIADENTPRRLWFTGLADMQDDGFAPRFYVGGAYFDPTGTLTVEP